MDLWAGAATNAGLVSTADNGDKGFIDDNLTTVLCSCAVAWVKQNPEAIPLLDADYIR